MENRSRKVCINSRSKVKCYIANFVAREFILLEKMYTPPPPIISCKLNLYILIFPPDVLTRFKDRLSVLSKELKACSKRPGEALVKASSIFVETIQKHVEGERIECIKK